MYAHVLSSPWAKGLSAILLTSALAACGGGSSAPDTAGVQVCGGKTSALVGKTLSFSTLSHNVSGTATVIDDCTIQLTNFNYDGGGLPDVFVRGATGGDYGNGFRIGNNLFGVVRNNATENVTLRAGDIDKLDGISIWCEGARVSFGDGIFK